MMKSNFLILFRFQDIVYTDGREQEFFYTYFGLGGESRRSPASAAVMLRG